MISILIISKSMDSPNYSILSTFRYIICIYTINDRSFVHLILYNINYYPFSTNYRSNLSKLLGFDTILSYNMIY